jgi:hypothetical protein
MNPIFFPSTWIPQADLDLLLACFRQVTLLQPARKLVPEAFSRLEEAGRLHIRLPEEETGDPLSDLLKDYHAWGDLHQGEPPDFRKFAQVVPAAPDDLSTEWIRNQIRHHEGDSTKRRSRNAAPNPILMARLFLAIAQEYDLQNESLSRDLDRISDMEKNMFRDLSPDEASPPSITAERPGRPRFETERLIPPEKRLAAWRLLFAHCHGPAAATKTSPSPFFVTNDQDSLRLVADSVGTPETVCRIEGILPTGKDTPFSATADHRRIDETLLSATRGGPLPSPPTFTFSNQSVGDGNTGSLVICRVRGNPVAPPHCESADRPGLPGTTEPGNENRFSLLGHFQRNCVLDSPNQLV